MKGVRYHEATEGEFRCPLIDSVEGDEIVILAVVHASRRPGYWVDRTSFEQP